MPTLEDERTTDAGGPRGGRVADRARLQVRSRGGPHQSARLTSEREETVTISLVEELEPLVTVENAVEMVSALPRMTSSVRMQ